LRRRDKRISNRDLRSRTAMQEFWHKRFGGL
jgi:hypothetical protein